MPSIKGVESVNANFIRFVFRKKKIFPLCYQKNALVSKAKTTKLYFRCLEKKVLCVEICHPILKKANG